MPEPPPAVEPAPLPPLPNVPPPTGRGAPRGRRMLVLLFVIALAPIVASTVIYVFFPRTASVNHGELLSVGPLPDIEGRMSDGTAFRLSALQGRWVLLIVTDGPCTETCREALYASRQARTMQGREQDRVVRVWLSTDATAPTAELMQAHPGLVSVSVPRDTLSRLPRSTDALYVVDPHGNLVLAYPPGSDIRGLAKDLKRLLRASSIG